MTRDPRDTAPEEGTTIPRARATDADTIARVSASVTLKLRHVIAILAALGLGGGFLGYKAVTADGKASEAKSVAVEAKQLGVAGAELAQTAAAAGAKDYANIKEKLDPTAEVAAAAASACATRAELEAVHSRIDSLPLAGSRPRRSRARRVPAAVVPLEVKTPLPATPAAAAAAAAPATP